MAFKTKIRDADVLHALLDLWEITCVHPKALSLYKFIKQYPVLSGSAPHIVTAIKEQSLLLTEGHEGALLRYRWNRLRCVTPTLMQARAILTRARELAAEIQRRQYVRKRAAAGKPVLMGVELHRFDGKTVTELIPLCNEIAGVIVAGDEVLVHPVFRDPFGPDRFAEYLEGPFRRKLVDGSWIDVEP